MLVKDIGKYALKKLFKLKLALSDYHFCKADKK